MFAVTYQAEELNLIPAIRHGQVLFNGDIDLNAKPDGSWEIENIWIATMTPPPQGIRYLYGLEKLAQDHPLHALIVKAAEAHDKATNAITDFVVDELEGASRAAYHDYRYQLGKDTARGLELR
jgi:hypothetical protein